MPAFLFVIGILGIIVSGASNSGTMATFSAVFFVGGCLLDGVQKHLVALTRRVEEAEANEKARHTLLLEAVKATRAANPDGMLRVNCQHCGGRLKCTPEQLGTVAECSHCEQNTTLQGPVA